MLVTGGQAHLISLPTVAAAPSRSLPAPAAFNFGLHLHLIKSSGEGELVVLPDRCWGGAGVGSEVASPLRPSLPFCGSCNVGGIVNYSYAKQDPQFLLIQLSLPQGVHVYPKAAIMSKPRLLWMLSR